jgi:hypothetical protein
MNWFRAQSELSSGAVEGLNGRIRVVIRGSYGFRTFKAIEMALYHVLARMPGPKLPTDSAEEARFQSFAG